jgi:site-specific recombinase XerD
VDMRRKLMEGEAALPVVGEVRAGHRSSLPFFVTDGAGEEVETISAFLTHLALSDRSPLTCRSYAHDLLRWWRLLTALNVEWTNATTAEVAVLVGWLRSARNRQRQRRSHLAPGAINVKTGKVSLPDGYAPSTVNHALTTLYSFYAFHAHHERGPAVNPVPVRADRRALLAHRSPIGPHGRVPRAPLRQKIADRVPRAIPDPLWEELFASMTSHRDRALLAFYISSGARASELLGLRLEHVDWAGQCIWVLSKGSRLLEPVPASPTAFTHLALYLDEAGPLGAGELVWRTNHGESRPLTYWAMRRTLQRANERLGTNWTLHDLRHTAAARMAADPGLTLPEVQTVLRHAQVTTTQRYLAVGVEQLFDKMQQHFRRPNVERVYAAGYDPEDVKVVFGA